MERIQRGIDAIPDGREGGNRKRKDSLQDLAKRAPVEIKFGARPSRRCRARRLARTLLSRAPRAGRGVGGAPDAAGNGTVPADNSSPSLRPCPGPRRPEQPRHEPGVQHGALRGVLRLRGGVAGRQEAAGALRHPQPPALALSPRPDRAPPRAPPGLTAPPPRRPQDTQLDEISKGVKTLKQIADDMGTARSPSPPPPHPPRPPRR